MEENALRPRRARKEHRHAGSGDGRSGTGEIPVRDAPENGGRQGFGEGVRRAFLTLRRRVAEGVDRRCCNDVK